MFSVLVHMENVVVVVACIWQMCCPIEEKLPSSGNHKDPFDWERKMREIERKWLFNQQTLFAKEFHSRNYN